MGGTLTASAPPSTWWGPRSCLVLAWSPSPEWTPVSNHGGIWVVDSPELLLVCGHQRICSSPQEPMGFSEPPFLPQNK